MQSYLYARARWVVALLFALVAEPMRCGLPPVTGQAAEITPAMAITEGKTAQGFAYLFGGVSSNEREAMEVRAKDFNVALVFAEKSGPYVSDVQLVLATAKDGEILNITVDGPWFYIQLPAGVYDAKATFKGQTGQLKNLRVSKDKPVKQVFLWDLGETAQP